MMQQKLIVIALLLIVIMTGCQRLNSGTVIEKRYIPSHTTTQPMYMGGNWYFINNYHGDRWEFVVRGTTDKGKEITEVWTVTESKYNETNVGDLIMEDE